MKLFVTVVWVISTLILTVMTARLWVGDPSTSERVREAFGTALTNDSEKARAMVRGLPVICVASWGLALGGMPVVLDEARPGWRPFGLPIWTGVAVGIGLLLVGVLLDHLIISFNRPRFLVPPALRWEPGYSEVEQARADASAEGRTTPESAVEALYEEYADRWTQKRGGQSPPVES